jgi:hypothetical protein
MFINFLNTKQKIIIKVFKIAFKYMYKYGDFLAV